MELNTFNILRLSSGVDGVTLWGGGSGVTEVDMRGGDVR